MSRPGENVIANRIQAWGPTAGRIGAYSLCAFALLTPLGAWWHSVGDPALYLGGNLPPGQAGYAFAKLAGLLAMSLLFLQAASGMVSRLPFEHLLPAFSRRAHIVLGTATAVLVALHVGLFVVASSTRKKAIAWDLLLPNFSHGYYFTSISWGAFALYLLIPAIWAGRQLRRGNRQWKGIHMAWAPAFALAMGHALSIGSESRFLPAQFLYLAMATSITLLVVARLRRHLKKCRQALAMPGLQ